MAYLILSDYKRAIQTTELNAITSGDDSVRILSELSAIAEIRSNLIQKYDLAKEFSDTSEWKLNSVYTGNSRVYLNANPYSPTSAYALNELTLQSGKVYINTNAIALPGEAFNPAHWTLLGNQYDIFYVKPPYDEFDPVKNYKVGDFVFWKGKIYPVIKDSFVQTHEGSIQVNSRSQQFIGNLAPDDPNNRDLNIFGTGINYSFAGLLPTNSLTQAWSISQSYTVGNLTSISGINYVAVDASTGIQPGTDPFKWQPILFIFGDNRNQMLINMMLDICIYDMCRRVAPNNVPIAREQKWQQAMDNIKAFAKGTITAELSEIIPLRESPISYGGLPKRNNHW